MVKGQLYLQVSDKALRPMTLYYNGEPAVLGPPDTLLENENTEVETEETVALSDEDDVSEIDEDELESILRDDPEVGIFTGHGVCFDILVEIKSQYMYHGNPIMILKGFLE